MRNHYPNAVPRFADIVKVKHSILGINEFMRIVEVKTIRDAENNIVKQDVTLGDFNRHNRYLERISQAAQVVGGLGGGFANSYRTTPKLMLLSLLHESLLTLIKHYTAMRMELEQL